MDESTRARLEREISALIGSTFSGLNEELIALLGDPPNVSNVPASFWSSLRDRVEAPLAEKLKDIYVDASAELYAANALTIAVDWNLVNQRAADWARGYSFELVNSITRTTKDSLQSLVSNFFADPNQNIGSLTQSVSTLFGAARAKRIAVTEVTRASSMGEVEFARLIKSQSRGILVKMVWLTSKDELVCPICGPLDGKSDFRKPPPAHPNCRCALAIRIDE